MARHIMAVCVVCLLCADRLPCQQHIDSIILPVDGQQNNIEYQELNAKVFQRTDYFPIQETSSYHSNSATVNSRHNNNNDNNFVTNSQQKQKQKQEFGSKSAHTRRKRHAGHDHDASATQQRPEITEDFLERIFEEYGAGDGTINIEEFQRMLKLLGLHQLVHDKFSNMHNESQSCIGDSKLVQHVQLHDLGHHNEHHHEHHHNHNAVKCAEDSNDTQCAHAHAHSQDNDDAVALHHLEHHNNYTLNAQDVLNLCPVLLYQLASPLEIKRTGCIDSSVLTYIDKYETTQYKEDIMYVWIYAFISVFACGILGLVGVAIIPFMDSHYYKHILQFLVSLAVGTMTGDALLHLLPHSLAGQTESNMIYKGLTCMSGIIFFYITEHGLTMISEWRRRTQKETNKPSRAKVVRDPESSINNSMAGDKLCKSKYSSYPYCYDEIALDTKNDMHLPTAKPQRLHSPNHADAHEFGNNIERKRNGKAEADASELAAAQSLLSTSLNNYAPMTDMNHHNQQQQHQHEHHDHQLPDSNTMSTDLDGNYVGDSGSSPPGGINGTTKDKTADNETVTVILREHEATHHGHSHTHGHVHSPPESLSAVAWMIIMGDGLHNFTDGMAIGAAFAENIAGGFSTSLAVFCHELPHELGDFAILIKAGMSVKSAVYYNLLTGILSFIGMIFGIVFGQSAEAAQWMFAAAAGLFIYIALVDMMPELSAAHKSLEQFCLQILGMCSGVLIMLLIAIYEGDLMNVFSASTVLGAQNVN